MAVGALFYKADLHIHSYGQETGSYDVTDSKNTPQAIVDTAIAKGLKIISITDHNQFLNSVSAVQEAKEKNILVIPGIEVSTTQGHLLLYFETTEHLRQFYGCLTFNEDRSVCNQGIAECLDFAARFNGIGILAHITLGAGFERTINRFGPHMEEIFKRENLLGLEIIHKEDSVLYTDEDSNPNHKNLLNIWRNASKNELHRDFAKVMSSDSHELSKLGNNIDGKNRLTRIKMSVLTFRAFKNALLSSESRVRLEDQIPLQRPIITHVKLDGELLDGIDTDISPNLTCIIGSRGAGKSTLLESIREATGNKSFSKICDSEVWPQNIVLDYKDEAGRLITLQREKNGCVVNRADIVNGITKIPIESYGQGDTARTLQHGEENPQVIIDFLDSFLDLDFLKRQDTEYVEQLRRNLSEIRKLRVNLVSLPEAQKALANEQQKLKILEQSKAADIVKLHNALIQERAFRNSLMQALNELIKTYKGIFDNKEIFERVAAMNDDNIIVGKDCFAKVKELVNTFSAIVASKSSELDHELNSKIVELKQQLKQWNSNEKEIQEKIDIKRQELTQQSIPFDLGKINQISKDIIVFDNKVKNLLNDKKRLAALIEERTKILTARQDNKKEITRRHRIFAEKITNNLKNSVDEFFINVKYTDCLHSPDFEETLKNLMGWRTSQVSKSKIIAQNIRVDEFVQAIKKKDVSALKNIKNPEFNLTVQQHHQV